MSALASATILRSVSFFDAIVDTMEKAVAMARAVNHDSVDAGDLKKVRAIADTI